MLMIDKGTGRNGRGRYFDHGILGETGWFMKLTTDWYVSDEIK